MYFLIQIMYNSGDKGYFVNLSNNDYSGNLNIKH